MKKKLAQGIVKSRILFLVLILACAVFGGLSIGRTKINYDLTKYLDQNTMTQRALKVMEEEFGSSEQVRMMFHDRTPDRLQQIQDELSARPEIMLATHDPEKDVRENEEGTCQLVTLTLRECDAPALVTELRTMFPDDGDYAVGGFAAYQIDVQKSVADEVPWVMMILVAIVLVVLLLTSRAWLEPVIILIVLGVSIAINMGTNFIFPDVSFVTFSVSAVLQLALSIDYAIMLLHTWNACCDEGKSAKEAMEESLAQCFMRISSSAMTTVAGLMSLLFMSFTIGFDIGLVLSKGILISMLCVFLLMPAIVLLLQKPLKATRHRPLRLGGEHLAKGVWKGRKIVAAVLVLAVLCGAWLTTQNTFIFLDPGTDDQSESARINRAFGVSNPLVLLVPGGEEDADYAKQKELVDKLEALQKEDGTPILREVTAMVTTGAKEYTVQEVCKMTGLNQMIVSSFFTMQGFGTSIRADRLIKAAGALKSTGMLPAGNDTVEKMQELLETAKETFNGPHYTRMITEPDYLPSDAEAPGYMDAILETLRSEYGDDFYVTGTPMSSYDISHAFRGDLTRVNLITLLAILLIVILSFRAIPLPVLLVFVIEGAIWITMGFSTLISEPIFFISYLICLAIQMGATIDYAILLSDQYRTLRRTGKNSREALTAAMEKSLPTILTSGIILISAGLIVGKRCSEYYISSIGMLIFRGALVSVILVLTLLPALLAVGDRVIMRKKDRQSGQTEVKPEVNGN